MFDRKRFLSLASISMLLLSGLMVVAHTQLVPAAHANGCNTVATGREAKPFYGPTWGNNCEVGVGNVSNLVSAVQVIMNAYFGADPRCDTPLTVDGNFGAQTKTAVMCFQSDSLLNPDGVVGTQTWQALAGVVQWTGIAEWDNYTMNASGIIYFRMWDSSGIWYVNTTVPPHATHWCQMNTSAPC
jgi:hypothetical protein